MRRLQELVREDRAGGTGDLMPLAGDSAEEQGMSTARAQSTPAARPRRHRFQLESTSPGMGAGIVVSLLPGILLFGVFFLVPLVVVALTSLTDWGPIEFAFTGTENFRGLIGDDAFWAAVHNTVLFVGAGVFIQVPVGVALAVILSRRIRGWRVLRAIYFLPNVISYAALALVYLTFYNPRYGLLNQALQAVGVNSSRDWLFDVDTALPAVAATWVFTAGLTMVLVMGEIAAIPSEIYEAARVDGAARWQISRHITLPLLRNVIGVCTTLVMLSTLAYFDGVYIMTGGGPADHTLTLSLYAFQQYSNSNWGYANTVAVALLIVGLISVVVVRRLFRIGERDF